MRTRIKKSLMVAGTLATVGISSLGAAGLASADTGDGATGSTGSSIVDKLAAKFGLEKSKIQAVFDEQRTEHQAERLANITEKLAQGVKDGDITQTQSDAILAKHKENQANREANIGTMKDLSDDERKAKMEEKRSEFEAWMSDNDIPKEYARLAMGAMHLRGGPGKMGIRSDSN